MEADHRRNLGKLARSRIIEKFSIDRAVARYQQVFEEILAQKRKGVKEACAA
jgi:hypothetical protein